VTAALDLMRESTLDVTMILHYASDDAVQTASGRGRTALRPARDGAASCAERAAQDASRCRPSPTQVSVSVGRASFENGVCHTW
jgi:hypothetical protein